VPETNPEFRRTEIVSVLQSLGKTLKWSGTKHTGADLGTPLACSEDRGLSTYDFCEFSNRTLRPF